MRIQRACRTSPAQILSCIRLSLGRGVAMNGPSDPFSEGSCAPWKSSCKYYPQSPMAAWRNLKLPLPKRGGKRKGAGRKVAPGRKAGVIHSARPQFDRRRRCCDRQVVRDHVGICGVDEAVRLVGSCLADAPGASACASSSFSVMATNPPHRRSGLSEALHEKQGFCIRIASLNTI